MDLKKQIIYLNKSRKSLGAISKQLQLPRATAQTIVCQYKVDGTVLSHGQEENASYHLLLREDWSGGLSVNREPPKTRSTKNVKLLEHSCQCPQSGVFCISMD